MRRHVAVVTRVWHERTDGAPRPEAVRCPACAALSCSVREYTAVCVDLTCPGTLLPTSGSQRRFISKEVAPTQTERIRVGGENGGSGGGRPEKGGSRGPTPRTAPRLGTRGPSEIGMEEITGACFGARARPSRRRCHSMGPLPEQDQPVTCSQKLYITSMVRRRQLFEFTPSSLRPPTIDHRSQWPPTSSATSSPAANNALRAARSSRCSRPSPGSSGVTFGLGTSSLARAASRPHVPISHSTLLASSTCAHNHSWLAWTCDAIDFFSVSLSVAHLQTQFDRSTHDIVRPPPPFSPLPQIDLDAVRRPPSRLLYSSALSEL